MMNAPIIHTIRLMGDMLNAIIDIFADLVEYTYRTSGEAGLTAKHCEK